MIISLRTPEDRSSGRAGAQKAAGSTARRGVPGAGIPHPALSSARLRSSRGFLPESDVQSPERRHKTMASPLLGMGGELGDASGAGERLPGRAEPTGGLMQGGSRTSSP